MKIVTNCGVSLEVTPSFIHNILDGKELDEIYIEENYPCTCSLTESDPCCTGDCVPDEVWNKDFTVKEIIEDEL